jgi:hypothetical protein
VILIHGGGLTHANHIRRMCTMVPNYASEDYVVMTA